MFNQHQFAILNKINTGNIEKESILASTPNNPSELLGIKGIGEGTLKILSENNIKSKEALLSTSEEDLRKMITNPLSLKGVLTFINENKGEILKTSD